MKAVIYTRVSTDEQAKEGYSLELQERQCREFAQKVGYTVVAIYSDPGFSGALKSRPGIDRLMADSQKISFDLLITWKFDRLFRTVEYQKEARRELADRGIVWKSVTEDIDIYTSSGNLQHSIHATFSEWERDLICERTTNGRHQKARSGRQPTVANRPYGYRIIKKTDAQRDLRYAGRDGEYEIVEDEAVTVKRIFRLYLEGLSLWRICGELVADDVPTMKGGKWKPNIVKGILNNTVYSGTAYHSRWHHYRTLDTKTGKYKKVARERPKDEWIPIPCPALVSIEDFERVQEIMKTNQSRKSGRPDRVYPLTGLIRCRECGSKYHGITKNKAQDRYYRPDVKRYPGQEDICRNITWRGEQAEKGILELLSVIAADPDLILKALRVYWEEEDRKNDTAMERKCLEEDLAKVERQLRTLIEKEMEEPEMAAIYADMRAERKAARQSLMEQLAKLPEEVEKPEPPRLKDIEAVCEELASRLVGIEDPKVMREVFLSLVESVEVEPDGNLLVRFHADKLFMSLRRGSGTARLP